MIYLVTGHSFTPNPTVDLSKLKSHLVDLSANGWSVMTVL